MSMQSKPMQIVPFTIRVLDEVLSDLRTRIRNTRWPDQAPGTAWAQGTDLGYLKRLLSYWANGFDWRAQERRLNTFKHFRAELGAIHVHFVHERAREGNGIPLILTHGWPSSFLEFLPLVTLLTNPKANGIDAPAFDLVIPSLPGYGFSERPAQANYRTVARLWHTLMHGLGYERYGAGGGDFGAGVATYMAIENPAPVIGIHLTTPELWPPTGEGTRSLTEAETAYVTQVRQWDEVERGYSAIQSTKPQTLGYALNDSPAGLAAWILEKWRATNSSSLDFMKPNRHPNINHLAQRIARLRSSQSRQLTFLFALTLLVTTITAGAQQKKSSFADLTKLFAEWRAFQRPDLIDGVPDYTARAMSAQHRELPAFQRRLADIGASGWPIREQVDWHIVRAEMNGLDFDHRVLRPWANNPGFYVTVFFDQSDQPAREGPHAYGAVEIWRYTFPLSAERATEMDAAIRNIPKLLEQARKNLVGKSRDLWIYGTKDVREQSSSLTRLATMIADAPGGLKSDIARAKEATDRFVEWLEAQAPSKTAPSGIGIEHYDWYLKNVQLVPYTWQEEVALMESELARAHAFLAIEEEKNKDLPQPAAVASDTEYTRRFNAGVAEYMSFLKDREILTIKEYMDPALRAQIGKFNPGPREFFGEIDYRDPVVMRTHGYHWFDLAQMEHEPHADPIRRGPLLYNIFNTRTEGHATGWEELMMQAGMFEARPRSRELIYILIAERAARALGELRMVSGEFTLEQAAEFTSHNTPRGWLSLKGNLVRSEQHLYLQQPGYGTSYLVGKKQLEMLLAARKMQLGESFRMKQFMDSFNAAGLVPASLLRWELAGQMPDDVQRMLASH